MSVQFRGLTVCIRACTSKIPRPRVARILSAFHLRKDIFMLLHTLY